MPPPKRGKPVLRGGTLGLRTAARMLAIMALEPITFGSHEICQLTWDQWMGGAPIACREPVSSHLA